MNIKDAIKNNLYNEYKATKSHALREGDRRTGGISLFIAFDLIYRNEEHGKEVKDINLKMSHTLLEKVQLFIAK